MKHTMTFDVSTLMATLYNIRKYNGYNKTTTLYTALLFEASVDLLHMTDVVSLMVCERIDISRYMFDVCIDLNNQTDVDRMYADIGIIVRWLYNKLSNTCPTSMLVNSELVEYKHNIITIEME